VVEATHLYDARKMLKKNCPVWRLRTFRVSSQPHSPSTNFSPVARVSNNPLCTRRLHTSWKKKGRNEAWKFLRASHSLPKNLRLGEHAVKKDGPTSARDDFFVWSDQPQLGAEHVQQQTAQSLSQATFTSTRNPFGSSADGSSLRRATSVRRGSAICRPSHDLVPQPQLAHAAPGCGPK